MVGTVKELKKALVTKDVSDEHEFDNLLVKPGTKIKWDEVEKHYQEAFKHFNNALKKAGELEKNFKKMGKFIKEKKSSKTFNCKRALSMIDFYLNGFKALIEPGTKLHGNKEYRQKLRNVFTKRKEYHYQLEQESSEEVLLTSNVLQPHHLNSFIGGLRKYGFTRILKPGYGTIKFREMVETAIRNLSTIGYSGDTFSEFKELLRKLREQYAFCIMGTTDWMKRLTAFTTNLDLDKLEVDPELVTTKLMTKIWKKLKESTVNIKIANPSDTEETFDPSNPQKNFVEEANTGLIQTAFLHLESDDVKNDTYSLFPFKNLSNWADLEENSDFKKKRKLFAFPLRNHLDPRVRKSSAGKHLLTPKTRREVDYPLEGLPLRWDHVKRVIGMSVDDLRRAKIIDEKLSKKGEYYSKKFRELGVTGDAGDYRFVIDMNDKNIAPKLMKYVKKLQVGRTTYNTDGSVDKLDIMSLFTIIKSP